jgi:microcystin degradation protein MlrC
MVLADTQNNPGGGGHGDTPELLAELVRQNALRRRRLPDAMQRNSFIVYR